MSIYWGNRDVIVVKTPDREYRQEIKYIASFNKIDSFMSVIL